MTPHGPSENEIRRTPDQLRHLVSAIFAGKGVDDSKAQRVAESLVLSNLVGHDSHGVIRVAEYLDWIDNGTIDPSAELEVIDERPSLLLVDGHHGFGQVIGQQAWQLAIDKAKRETVTVLTLRNSAHLGRLGEYAELAAEQSVACFAFTNVQGGAIVVAPHGGIERRLSANPITAGAPSTDGPMIMDFATSAIADGKVKVASALGLHVPANTIIDSAGRATTDPASYLSDPPGALLPFAGHKGYALALFSEMFAGVLASGGTARAGARGVANALLAVFLDIDSLVGRERYSEDVRELVGWVKSSKCSPGVEEIVVPGDPERRTRAEREREGITVDAKTWASLERIATDLELPRDLLDGHLESDELRQATPE